MFPMSPRQGDTGQEASTRLWAKRESTLGVLLIEGVCGAGKTTLLRALGGDQGVRTLSQKETYAEGRDS